MHQVLVPWQKGELFHVLFWQSRPSCSNDVPHFREAVVWCSTACGDTKVFWVACAAIGYLRDAWAQYSREDFWGGESIRLEWKSFISRSILAIPSWDNGFPLVLRSMNPPHTRSRSTETWTGASQRSLGRALLPSLASSSLSSSLDVKKCLPPYRFSSPSAFARQV